MIRLLRRLKLIIKVLLNAFLASAEDPRQIFADAYERQQQMLSKVRHAQANVAASKNQLKSINAGTRNKLPQLDEQIRKAVVSGRDDLARFALRFRIMAKKELETLDKQVQELEEEEQVLSLVEQRQTTQIELILTRQEMLEAQYSTAEAHVQIHEALTGVSKEIDGLGLALERAEQRTEHMRARASAVDQLIEQGVLEMPGQSDGEVTGYQLSDESALEDVERHLDELKQRLRPD